MKRIVKSLIHKIEEKIDVYDCRIQVIGRDIESTLINNYHYTKFIESFSETNNEYGEDSVLLVIGDPNLNQVELIKDICDKNQEKIRKIIQVKSGLSRELLDKSYFLADDLSSHIDLEILYKEFPLDLADLMNSLKNVERGVS